MLSRILLLYQGKNHITPIYLSVFVIHSSVLLHRMVSRYLCLSSLIYNEQLSVSKYVLAGLSFIQ